MLLLDWLKKENNHMGQLIDKAVLRKRIVQATI